MLGRTNAFFLGGGKALVNAYYRTAEALGVEVVYDAEAEDLAIETAGSSRRRRARRTARARACTRDGRRRSRPAASRRTSSG